MRNLTLLLVALTSNLVFYLLIRIYSDIKHQKLFAGAWITLDIMLVTFLIYTNGGIESRSPILYAMPILMSAAIFGRKATYLTAIASGLMYICLILFDYFRIIPTTGAFNPALSNNLSYVVNSICFFPSILVVIALAADLITRLLIQKQQQASDNLDALIRAQDIAKLGSWEWDVKNNNLAWSDGFLKIYGIEKQPQNFNYESYLDMIHPDDIKNYRRTITTSIKKKQAFTIDHRVVMPDGTLKYIHGEGRPLFDHNGNVIKLLGTVQDVSDLHSLDEAKGEFVSLASHQPRTPASGVKAFLSLLLDGYAGNIPKKQQEFILRAYEANNRQLDIIDDLLSLAAIESGRLTLRKEPVDLNTVVRQCLRDHKPEMRAHKQILVTHYTRRPITVTADTSRLYMVVDNLISNAIKYSPEKGIITITVSQSKASGYIEVADTGIGIATENVPQLFQKFHRLRDASAKSVTGSGLGLYLAKYIVRLHKGSITVHSKYGQGSQFKVRLPLLSRST